MTKETASTSERQALARSIAGPPRDPLLSLRLNDTDAVLDAISSWSWERVIQSELLVESVRVRAHEVTARLLAMAARWSRDAKVLALLPENEARERRRCMREIEALVPILPTPLDEAHAERLILASATHHLVSDPLWGPVHKTMRAALIDTPVEAELDAAWAYIKKRRPEKHNPLSRVEHGLLVSLRLASARLDGEAMRWLERCWSERASQIEGRPSNDRGDLAGEMAHVAGAVAPSEWIASKTHRDPWVRGRWEVAQVLAIVRERRTVPAPLVTSIQRRLRDEPAIVAWSLALADRIDDAIPKLLGLVERNDTAPASIAGALASMGAFEHASGLLDQRCTGAQRGEGLQNVAMALATTEPAPFRFPRGCGETLYSPWTLRPPLRVVSCSTGGFEAIERISQQLRP